jgi:hypothetical protein
VKYQNLTKKTMMTQSKSVHLEDVQEKMNVTCTFEEYVKADNLSCAVHETSRCASVNKKPLGTRKFYFKPV